MDFEALSAAIARIEAKLSAPKTPAFYMIEQAAELKGGPSVGQYKRQRKLQPCCGKCKAHLNGRKVWSRDEVVEWLGVTDENYAEYANKYKGE